MMKQYHCNKCDTYDVRVASHDSSMFVDPRCVNCNGELQIG